MISALETESLYLTRHWDPSPKRGMDAQVVACILESAATNDMAALRILHSHYVAKKDDEYVDTFSAAHGLETSLAAGHVDLLMLDMVMVHPQQSSAVPLWLAAAKGGNLAALEKMGQVYGPAPPDGACFLKRLYGSAPLSAVRWVRGALRDAGKLPPLALEHLRECARGGRVDVLQYVLGDGELSASTPPSPPPPPPLPLQDIANGILNFTICAPVFPLQLATLLCSGELTTTMCSQPLLPAVSEAGRSAALCLAAGRLSALQFLLQKHPTPWPAWLLPAFAAAGEDASLECLLDALPLAFPDKTTTHGDTVQYALSAALDNVRLRSRTTRSLKRRLRPRFETASALLVAVESSTQRAAAFALLERRIETALAALREEEEGGRRQEEEASPQPLKRSKKEVRWEDSEMVA